MNIAIVFAGGVGKRMNNNAKPKQFLELYGKPILIHTLEVFEHSENIDKIVVICVSEYIDKLKQYIYRYELEKIEIIVPGGTNGFESIYNGLSSLEGLCTKEDIVLIHDGVRPFIDEQLIDANISCVKKNGNAITSVPTVEGIIVSSDSVSVDEFTDRKKMYATKAPQSFKYGEIFKLYKKAHEEGFEPIESAHLCQHYGVKLYMVQGSYSNIKITTPTDYYVSKAICDAIENSQLIGY